MATETVLTDAQIFDCFDTHNGTMCIDYDADELYPVGRAIEQAVLQSPEVQRLREDAQRLDILERDAGHFVFSVGSTWRTRPKPAQPGEFQEIAPKHNSLRDAIDAIAEKYK